MKEQTPGQEKGRIFPCKLIHQCLKENNLRDGASIAEFLKSSFGEFIQETLETEMDEELGYSRYDYKEKAGTNSRNGHHKKVPKTDMGNVEKNVRKNSNFSAHSFCYFSEDFMRSDFLQSSKYLIAPKTLFAMPSFS